MSEYPKDLRYTAEHEWIRQDGDLWVVGITAHAAGQLGDVTFVELPPVGESVDEGGEAGAVESVKAASDVYAPVAGNIAEINSALEDKPELVNQSPYSDGWFFKLNNVDPNAVAGLMDAAAYAKFVEENES